MSLVLTGNGVTYPNGETQTTPPIPLPTGMVCPFATTTAPDGWLECNGSAISRTTYSALFAIMGTAFGAGDGSTTFNLPDMRGNFMRGWDHGAGVDSGRVFGSTQESTGVPDRVTAAGAWPLNLSLANTDGTLSTFGDTIGSGGISGYGGGGSWTTTRYKVRPRNVAMMYCVKT